MDRRSEALRERVRSIGASCYALQARRTANLLARTYNRTMSSFGLEVAQFSTLCVVASELPLAIAGMAAQLGVERSTLVRNLGILERERLIGERGRDGRRKRYRLTAKGAAVLAAALPEWEALQSALAGALEAATDGDPRRAMSALRKAARSVSPQSAAP